MIFVNCSSMDFRGWKSAKEVIWFSAEIDFHERCVICCHFVCYRVHTHTAVFLTFFFLYVLSTLSLRFSLHFLDVWLIAAYHLVPSVHRVERKVSHVTFYSLNFPNPEEGRRPLGNVAQFCTKCYETDKYIFKTVFVTIFSMTSSICNDVV